MSDAQLKSAFGDFQLQRRPLVTNLKAWDGADEYLLELAAEHTTQHAVSSALIINDNFGALACALHHLQPVSWSDSYTTHLATRDNYARNGIYTNNGIETEFVALPSTASPSTSVDLVLWRVPKSLSLFEQQIARLRPALHETTVILVGGMDKHLPPDAKTLLARLGNVTTLPGKKKSHVFRVEFDPALPAPREPGVTTLPFPEWQLTLTGDAAVFAREKIDIGARFFIEQFKLLPPAQRIADLGCGSGILSLVLASMRPKSEIFGFDESYQASASAEHNWARNRGETATSHFHVDDGLSHYTGAPFELIVCNPPFHQQHVIGDHIARQLFAQAKQHLRKGGELWVVGNRHLDYQTTLRRMFGQCRQINANPKFVVLAATH